MEYKNVNISTGELDEKRRDFQNMMNFVEKIFPRKGFAKYEDSEETSRVYFEAISIGVHFALKENPNLSVKYTSWAHLDKKVML